MSLNFVKKENLPKEFGEVLFSCILGVDPADNSVVFRIANHMSLPLYEASPYALGYISFSYEIDDGGYLDEEQDEWEEEWISVEHTRFVTRRIAPFCTQSSSFEYCEGENRNFRVLGQPVFIQAGNNYEFARFFEEEKIVIGDFSGAPTFNCGPNTLSQLSMFSVPDMATIHRPEIILPRMSYATFIPGNSHKVIRINLGLPKPLPDRFFRDQFSIFKSSNLAPDASTAEFAAALCHRIESALKKFFANGMFESEVGTGDWPLMSVRLINPNGIYPIRQIDFHRRIP